MKNKGTQPISMLVDYLPSPPDVPPVHGLDPETGEEITRAASDSENRLHALAFKLADRSIL